MAGYRGNCCGRDAFHKSWATFKAVCLHVDSAKVGPWAGHFELHGRRKRSSLRNFDEDGLTICIPNDLGIDVSGFRAEFCLNLLVPQNDPKRTLSQAVAEATV